MAPNNPHGIRTFADLTVEGVKLINRQEGSGTRVLIDHNFQKLGIAGTKIDGYENEVFTHFEVGLSIISKEADVGIATSAIAKLLGLGFVPLHKKASI